MGKVKHFNDFCNRNIQPSGSDGQTMQHSFSSLRQQCLQLVAEACAVDAQIYALSRKLSGFTNFKIFGEW